MSTEHDVTVVRLGEIRKHENADSLGITEVDGRPCEGFLTRKGA